MTKKASKISKKMQNQQATQLSSAEIERVFNLLGLGTSQERERLLSRSGQSEAEDRFFSIRLYNSTQELVPVRNRDAKLEDDTE
ncbi:MAG: hypothetical protein HYW27_00545 [Candidatus Aenigmarchaeota archaeon]|nr:hypothetical protein [Candidatus Aenigmarchaeota archaeon]